MKTTSFKNSTLRLWLPYFLLSAALSLLVYVAVQQVYRQTADDPQIQMAEDTAAALSRGATPASLVPAAKVDMTSSLAPVLIVTDENLHVLASSGTLGGQTVLPPAGSFAAAKAGTGKGTTQAGENRITWQPASGVREAAVIVHYSGGYVLAARSLREVENREQNLGQMVGATLIGLVAAGIALLLIFK